MSQIDPLGTISDRNFSFCQDSAQLRIKRREGGAVTGAVLSRAAEAVYKRRLSVRLSLCGVFSLLVMECDETEQSVMLVVQVERAVTPVKSDLNFNTLYSRGKNQV